jgi:hypothetical protein
MSETTAEERLAVLQDFISGLSSHKNLRPFDGTVICCLVQILNHLKKERCTETV